MRKKRRGIGIQETECRKECGWPDLNQIKEADGMKLELLGKEVTLLLEGNGREWKES